MEKFLIENLINSFLEKENLILPYDFQKYLISDLALYGKIEKEDFDLFLKLLINLFVKIYNGSTAFNINKNDFDIKEIKKFFNKYNNIFSFAEENKITPFILREIEYNNEKIYFLYRYIDYIFEIELEKLISERLKNKSEGDKNYFLFITGGPGTGKTTKASLLVYEIYRDHLNKGKNDIKIKVCAPTGKATNVLYKSIYNNIIDKFNDNRILDKIETSTIHRLLNYNFKEDRFKFNKDYKIDADLIVVDEASMIDLKLFKSFLEAVDKNTKLIFIGDRDQIPSVENGNVFADIIENDKINKEELIQQYRFPQEISKIANIIKRGDLILKEKNGDIKLEDFIYLKIDDIEKYFNKSEKGVFFIDISNKNQILKLINIIVNNFKDKFDKIAILTLTNVGFLGTENINNIILRYFKKLIKKIPIVITENDYVNNLFNGEIGYIEDFYENNNFRKKVKFDEERIFNLNIIKAYKYAFALTVHKSQGSTYDTVFFILPEEEQINLLNREIIYTAITRAREKVFIIGKSKVFFQGVKNKIERDSAIKFIKLDK